MEENHFVKQIISLNNSTRDRHQFHALVAPILESMAGDRSFWAEVIRTNLTDKGYLNRKWTMYDIPFLYIYENDDFFVKAHIFPALESREKDILASTVHHHNNYLLTSYAAFGSGYESFLFEKDFKADPYTGDTTLKIKEHFRQRDKRAHLVDSWTPHAVVNPETFSVTLVLWSPDKKRTTDSLRSNPVLKFFKTPLRKLLYRLKLDRSVGIASEKTFQWFPEGKIFKGILEDEFFAPTRSQSGPAVDNYSVQSVFHFIQQIGFNDIEFLKKLKSNGTVPLYYHQWIDHLIERRPIPETYAKSTINIPSGRITAEDIFHAAGG